MNSQNSADFSYRAFDDISFALARGLLNKQNAQSVRANSMGPLVEFLNGGATGAINPETESISIEFGFYAPFVQAFKSGVKRWTAADSEKQGLFRLSEDAVSDSKQWMEFQVAAHKSAIQGGFHRRISAQLIGAMGELASNIYEHAGTGAAGFITYSASENGFEFGAYDAGIGALKTISSNPEYSNVASSGEALRLCLSEGVTRHLNSPDRGRGFRPIFVGLANLNGLLRFRSGDSSLMMDGRSRNLGDAKIARRTPIRGMSISIFVLRD